VTRFAVRLVHLWLLTLRIHLEALFRTPRPYLTAAKWRILRKRVRARAQFAPLLARSPFLYKRLVLQNDEFTQSSSSGLPPIIALVEDIGDTTRLATTMASLASENVPSHCVGSDVGQDLKRVADVVDWSSSAWLLPMTAGDLLVAGAASSYREAINPYDQPVIFADDDLIDARGRRTAPHFKPDWNPELFLNFDYLTGACIIRVDRAHLIDAAMSGTGWAKALVTRALEEGVGARHVRQILHSRRDRPIPRTPIPPLPIAPKVPCMSVIVPTRNRVDLLSICISGLDAAEYPDVEAIIVDNDSDDPATLEFLGGLPARSRSGRRYRVLRHPGPFNYSAINNRAVAEASGELICLLNNDIEMLAPDWLGIMATQALRDDVGAVGAQLLYPDGRIQHAGVVIGVGQAAGHAHRFLRPQDEGYFYRHALPQFVTAVTAACLVVQRERFLAVGGLDEAAFPVAFNDVDLCLKLNGRGWQSLYEPRAILVHHESISRGFDRDPVGAARFTAELAALQQRWRTDRIVDPFHHPHLSRVSEQFALAL
jgi:GT2 family glycosyltransferase